MDYLGIAELVRNYQISVLKSQIGGLQKIINPNAAYRSSGDYLYIYYDANLTLQKTFVVHEATHAIQDWTDVNFLIHDEETDALSPKT